MPTATRYHQHA